MAETKLVEKTSQAKTSKVNDDKIDSYMKQLRGWKREGNELVKNLKFEDYYQTMSTVVAVAMLAQREDHHPDMTVGYNKLTIRYSTHSVGGLSENDFICAARTEALVD